jgi:Abnormal spindle-like microcephaly-assoc'd, ASPM-SPD-2-Hydin
MHSQTLMRGVPAHQEKIAMPCSYACPTSSFSKVVSLLGIALLIVLCMASTVAAQASDSTKVQPAHPIHIVPMVTPDGKALPLPITTPHLNYYGGPVISNVSVVTVFWTNSVDAGVQTTMPAFYSAITDSTFYDMLSEYATNITPEGGGTGTNQSIGRGSTGGTFTITPSKCFNGSKCTIDDTAIQTELLAQITAGHLPSPTLDNNGNVNTLYMIYFPLNVTITQGGSQSCVIFCAYHGTTTNKFNSKNIAYGVFPDMGPSSNCFGGCGANADYLKDTTSVSSHELAEAVTDIDVGIAATLAPPLAWYDPNNGEIGDICNAQQATVTAGGSSWVVQKQWSNAVGGCVAVGKHPVYQVSAPANANPGTPFSLTVTAQNPTSGGTMTSYIGTVHFTSSDGAAVLPSDYTFTNGDQGTHTFSITLNTNGSQTVTGTDTVNSAVTAKASISVGSGGNGPLTLSPTSLILPNTKLGLTSAAKTVTVTNSNTVAVSVSSVGFTGANPGEFVISSNGCGASIAASSSCAIKVALAPKSLGLKNAALTLTDSATNSPQSVGLTGTGTPAIKLAPATVKFATTAVGNTSLVKIATFKNLLNTTVTLGGISITGANPGDFAISSKTCGGTVAGKSSCTISLTFSPSAIGARNATLQVLSNAIPSAISSALTGTGK